MMTTISIILLLLTITLSLGGGLYEILVIYPNWKHNVHPLNLRDKLESSGQNNAAKRFWVFVSPAQGLLAMLNIALACWHHGSGQGYWLAAAIIIFITRIITFSYFIPVMVRNIMQPEKFDVVTLQAIVKQWTDLSPLRLVPEFVAWGLLMMALMKI